MSTTPPPTGRLLKHSTIYAIGNITRQLVGFLMLPIYTRCLTPADYGVVGLLTFAMAIMEPFFGARLGEAMPKYYFEETEPAKKNAVISTALIITGTVSASTSLILYLLKEQTSSLLFGASHYGLVVGLFGILILTQAVEYYGMTFIRILQKPILFITVSLTKLVLQLSMNIALVVWLKMGVMGAVISGVASSSAFALGLCIYIVVKAGTRFDRKLAGAMLKFSWPLWFVGLATLYIYSSNRYYIRVFGSLSDVGLYELAAKFGTILTFLVMQPFNQFWETERFNYHRQPNGQQFFASAYQLISMALIAAAICIGVAAEPVIRVMAAPEFHTAYLAVPLLLIGFLAGSLCTFANFSFLVTEKTQSISHISYATAALITVLNLALIPAYGYIGAATALAIALLFQFLVTFYRGRKLYDMQINIGPTFLMFGLLGVVFVLAVYVFRSDNIWMDILAKSLLLAMSLGMFCFILWKTKVGRSQISNLARTVRARLAA